MGEERRPPRGHDKERGGRGEGSDICVRTSLPQTLQQQQDPARISFRSRELRLAAIPSSLPLPSAGDPSIPIRDLWIIVRLIPPAPPKRESIAEGEDSIRFDDVSTTSSASSSSPSSSPSSSSSRTDLLISRRQYILCSRMQNRNGIKD